MENCWHRLVVCCFTCAASAIAAGLLQVLNGMTLSIEWYHVASLCQDMVAEPLSPCSCCCRSSNSCKIKSNTSENPDRCMHRIKGGGGEILVKSVGSINVSFCPFSRNKVFNIMSYSIKLETCIQQIKSELQTCSSKQLFYQTHTHTHTHARMHARTHNRMHQCTHKCTYKHNYTQTNTRKYVNTDNEPTHTQTYK